MGEVVIDDFLSFGAGDVAEALGEAEGRDTVRDAEVDHFSGAALIAVDLLGGDVEEACGGGGMDVLPGAEGFEESGILTEGGEDAELDLRVVGGEELPTVARDEGFADLPASLAADGDVLEVGVVGGEASGGGLGLAEVCVYALGDGVDGCGQGVDVGGFELRELAVLEDLCDDGVIVGKGC